MPKVVTSSSIDGLISKPQFDPETFKSGHPVRLSKISCNFPDKEDYRWRDKFTSGEFGLIYTVEPLFITILLSNEVKLRIPVELVACRAIEIFIIK